MKSNYVMNQLGGMGVVGEKRGAGELLIYNLQH
jgi:hypothetical protein